MDCGGGAALNGKLSTVDMVVAVVANRDVAVVIGRKQMAD